MGLQALVETKAANPKANKVDLMLADMTSEQVDLFRTVIHRPDEYSAATVAEALQADGHSINAGQINHYRRKLREGSARI